jgi:methylated-DNA-[protein]-cysteine S-methyltransferase
VARSTPALSYSVYDSPIGPLLLAGRDATLHTLWFMRGRRPPAIDPSWSEVADAFPVAVRQLTEYFAGTRMVFDLALAPHGTAFQQRVWRALQEIPYGETRSYGDVARQLGDAKAVRAVGLANGANPIPIVIPCHRVIGAGGSLVGFGGGLPTKRALLDLERGQRTLL